MPERDSSVLSRSSDVSKAFHKVCHWGRCVKFASFRVHSRWPEWKIQVVKRWVVWYLGTDDVLLTSTT